MPHAENPNIVKEWVENWKQLHTILDELHTKELRELQTQEGLAVLEHAFNQALKDAVYEPYSGLIEFQDQLRKIKK